MRRPRVVVLRGHNANPWELGAWELLADRFEVVVAVTGSNRYAVSVIAIPARRVRALRDLLPGGRLGDLMTLGLGDRYVGLAEVVAGADIVHSAEIGVWWSGQPAELKAVHGFKLALTVWETIPFLETYRRFRGRADRGRTIAVTDLYLAATDRARRCLELEGVQPERIVVSPPGIDVDRFRQAAASPAEHVVVSPGRLVWEKGHFDVLRAVASLDLPCRVELIGDGPERTRLLAYAKELGLADRVSIRAVSYEEMPTVFARASCVVLGSLPIPMWEEQFGMVLAEAMAAGAPILASASGAIPEVLAGSGVPLFTPGDWPGLAAALAAGPLARDPGLRATYPDDLVRRYSTAAAAERLAAAYDGLLSE